MALVTANQFQMVPDAVGSFTKGRQQGQQIMATDMAIEAQRLKQQQAQQAQQNQAQLGQFSGQALAGNKDALGQVAQADPQRAKAIQGFLSQQSEEQRAETAREQESLSRSAADALTLPRQQRRAFIAQKRQQAISEGRSTENIDAALAIQDDAELEQALMFQVRQGQEFGDILKQQFPTETTGTASQKDFETFQNLLKTDPEKAQVFGRQAGFIRETEQEKADIDVSKTEKKEIIRQRVKRTSDIKTELAGRNRNAARSGRTLRQALTLAKTASQGLGGAAKLQLSRLIPGIDVTDEAGLDATLKELALEQLQNFKGPTTDFEFGVTQAIAGSLGNSQTANIARIKSLDRARFFNERELKQFNSFIKDGGDPDNFSFNYNEQIKTKKGPFTLQAIQDTAVENNLTIEETIKRLNE